jgi:hypothetical protein
LLRVTMVPTPASVKTSSSSAWGTRPSMMTADSTPEFTASMQFSTLGIMPPEMVPSAISARACSTVMSWMSWPFLSRTPGTSVGNRRRLARMAPAMAPAEVSELML